MSQSRYGLARAVRPEQASAWLKSLPRDQFPNTVELADQIVAGSARERFDWGLDVIIRGLSTYLTDPPRPEDGWPVPAQADEEH